MPASRARTLPTSLLALVSALVLALVLAGCGGSEKKVDTDGDGKPDTPVSQVRTPSPPPPDPRFEIPTLGQCSRMTLDQSRAPVAAAPAIGCRKPHTTVVAYVGLLPEAITLRTPLPRRRAVAARLCEPAFVRVAGGDPVQRATTLLTWAFFTPSTAQLARGARWVRCDVLARSARDLVPLPASTPVLRGGIPEPLRVCQTRQGVDVSCAKAHAFRVAAVFRPAGPAYPDARFTVTARARCAQLTGEPGGYWQPPSRAGWASGDRFVRCLTSGA